MVSNIKALNSKSKILAIGAEATITLEQGNKILKHRIKKSYRIKEIDEKLRSQRARKEASILEKLSKLDFPAPKVISEDGKSGKLEIEFLEGKKVRDILSKSNSIKLSAEIGKKIAVLHKNKIIHGDLTTSNMIFHNNEIYFIDFGLSFVSERVEDMAVDLHLFRQALESKHCEIWEKAFDACIKAYKAESKLSNEVIKRFKIVERRGRHKGKGS